MRIFVIPDCQVKDGVPTDHLTWAGKYVADKKPDVIVNIGDFWDMPSLSSYDKGRKCFEGRRYSKDIVAGNKAMDLFLDPIRKEQKKLNRKGSKKKWKPRLVFTMGNHEYRINRAVDSDAILEDVISTDDFNLEGWEVYTFLEPVVIQDVAFCHYFTSGDMGRAVGKPEKAVARNFKSCVMGHVQTRQIHYSPKTSEGLIKTGIFAGIFYQHEEAYLNPQTNKSWAGCWMLHDVKNGGFNEEALPMDYLKKRYLKR